jgi:hypothetical protein
MILNGEEVNLPTACLESLNWPVSESVLVPWFTLGSLILIIAFQAPQHQARGYHLYWLPVLGSRNVVRCPYERVDPPYLGLPSHACHGYCLGCLPNHPDPAIQVDLCSRHHQRCLQGPARSPYQLLVSQEPIRDPCLGPPCGCPLDFLRSYLALGQGQPEQTLPSSDKTI